MPDETLISADLEGRKGRWSSATNSPPVTASDIRKWAIATYWPETPPRLFWDEGYAAGTRWDGIVAPSDFNPFAWPVHPSWMAPALGPDGRKLTSLNGGQVETYGVRQRPGDVISERTRVADFFERQGRFGLMLHVAVEAEWTNQMGELVRRRIHNFISY